MDDDGGLMWWAQVGQWLALDLEYQEWINEADQRLLTQGDPDDEMA